MAILCRIFVKLEQEMTMTLAEHQPRSTPFSSEMVCVIVPSSNIGHAVSRPRNRRPVAVSKEREVEDNENGIGRSVSTCFMPKTFRSVKFWFPGILEHFGVFWGPGTKVTAEIISCFHYIKLNWIERECFFVFGCTCAQRFPFQFPLGPHPCCIQRAKIYRSIFRHFPYLLCRQISLAVDTLSVSQSSRSFPAAAPLQVKFMDLRTYAIHFICLKVRNTRIVANILQKWNIYWKKEKMDRPRL